MDKLFKQITAWQRATFPMATTESCINHLIEEVNELKESYVMTGSIDKFELIDCFMLLFAICDKSGMNVWEIDLYLKEKLKIVKQRKYGEPNELGYQKHIKDGKG